MRLLQGLMAVCFLTILPGMTVPALAGGDDAGRPLSGVLAAANGQVTAQKAGDRSAPPRRLEIGAKLFFEDEVVTAAGVQAQILLRDGTTFSIGENATLVLDEFVYDPATDNGAVGAVIKRGAFRFISGKIAKKQPSNMQVLAGNTAIAVRGTEVIGNVGGGSETVILLSGQVDLQSTAGIVARPNHSRAATCSALAAMASWNSMLPFPKPRLLSASSRLCVPVSGSRSPQAG